MTVQPRMYREALALALHRHRPAKEVMLGPLDLPDGRTGDFRPHMLVRNDGKVWNIEDVSMDGLFALVDETEGLIPNQTVGRCGSSSYDPCSRSSVTSEMVIQSSCSAFLAASPLDRTFIFLYESAR